MRLPLCQGGFTGFGQLGAPRRGLPVPPCADIAFVVELSERTIQRVLFRLEDNTPADMERKRRRV